MSNGDETADSYKMSAELLLSRQGDKLKMINYLFNAAEMYSEKNHIKALDCLSEIHNNVKGSTVEFGMTQYIRYLHRLAKAYENLKEPVLAADMYHDLANEIFRLKERLHKEKIFSKLETEKKFAALLAKALSIYDSEEKYDLVLKLARKYFTVFVDLQKNKSLYGELYFCYKHIINAADQTGSRYFREYFSELDNALRGIPVEYESRPKKKGKGRYA